MFRSIRTAIAKSRHTKANANARRLLLESLEQRRLLAVSPVLSFASTDLATTSAIYGPVHAGEEGPAAINLQAEGEDSLLTTSSAARQLLFAGIAGSTASPTNSGLLTIIESATASPPDSIVPLNAHVAFGGIAGLAFDLSGHLYATVDQGPCTPSDLVELNPANGAVLRRFSIMAGSTEINIGDLAVEPATGRLFGIRSVHDIANLAGELYVIDVDSGVATLVGDTGTGAGEGLAFASDGALYLAGTAGAKPVLYKIDPATAEPHQRDAVTGLAIPFVVLNDPTGRLKRVEGLVGHPDNGTIVATGSMTRFDTNQIVDDTYAIDLSTGLVTAQPLASPARGIFGDLAFQPSPRVMDIVYQENFESGSGGFVVDNTGGTLPGLWHYSLGRRYDSLPSHTPISSFYYGAFETAFGEGHYVLPLDHQGTLTSSPIQLPTSSVLSFNYLLDTRPELDVDFVDVSVITADGSITQILSRADGTLPQTGRQHWRTATADLSQFGCQPIQLQFSFDTGPPPIIDPEGWYIDDLMIGSTGGFCDFGDAPDNAANLDDYPTLLVSNGARHGIVYGLRLGSTIDAEPDGQPTPLADGDDNNPPTGPDDEDGVVFASALVPGETARVSVAATGSGLLNAWIDFNGDGHWQEPDELVFRDVPLVNETKVLSFEVPVTAVATDLAAGRFRFSTQSGLRYDGAAADGEVEDHTVTIDAAAPSIEIDKSLFGNSDEDGSRSVTLGDTLTYHFDVTNAGNQTLTDILVSDPLLGAAAIEPPGLARLAPGATATFSGTYVVRQSDMDETDREINNTATVTATDPQGQSQSDMDGVAVPVDYDPSIEIDKSLLGNADEDRSGGVTLGDTLTYHFDVTNAGNQTLTDILVSDPLLGAAAIEPPGLARLSPGATATFSGTYVVRQSDMDETDREINNTATVTATDPQGQSQSDMDGVAVPVDYDPSIEIDKSLSGNADEDGSESVTLGDTLTYRFNVTNTGRQTLTNILVSDPLPGLSAVAPSGVTRLAPGETATFTATYVVRQRDLDDPDMEINNTATVTATDPMGSPWMAMDSERVMVEIDSSIGIDKLLFNTADEDRSGTVTLGDTLTYRFNVTNTGSQTLTNILVRDSLPGLRPIDPVSVASLAPGAMTAFTATYVVQQSDMDDPDGEINNTATATGTDPKGNALTSTDREVVNVEIDPKITIDKSLSNNLDEDVSGSVTLGDTLTYRFKVTNTGLQTLTNVQVRDPLPELSPISPSSVASLPPHAEALFTATYVVKLSDINNPVGKIINTATATGTDPKGMLRMHSDTEEVPVAPMPPPPARQVVRFITPLSAYRPDGSFVRPPDSQLAIRGVVQANGLGVDGAVVYVDLNNNGVLDRDEGELSITTIDGGEFWFKKVDFAAAPTGTFVLRVDSPGSNGPFQQITLPIAVPVIFAVESDFVNNPPSGNATIKGYRWNDLDQDGQWDRAANGDNQDEAGRAGWGIYLDLDDDPDFDPQTEPFTVTDANGRYIFANVAPGNYVIRENRDELSAGTRVVQQFPQSDAMAGARHVVTVGDRQVLEGAFGIAETPNFGSFDYSRMIRPASDFFGHLDIDRDGEVETTEIAGHRDNQNYMTSTQTWQTFDVSNSSTRPLVITEIRKVFRDFPPSESQQDQFVTIFQVERDGNGGIVKLSEPSLPLHVAPGASVEFFAFYDPAIRNAARTVVEQQFPDWYDDPNTVVNESNTRPAHNLGPTTDTQGNEPVDHIEVMTEYGDTLGSGPTFRVDVVGASTFDSDIFYDGVVDRLDLGRLSDDLLARQSVIPDGPVQRVSIDPHTAATSFQLSFDGQSTAPIPVSATARDVELALEALPNVSNVVVYQDLTTAREFGWRITFVEPRGSNLALLQFVSATVGTVTRVESLFDVTSDVNARCPNGAEGVVNTCAWTVDGSPRRELGLGDFGPIQVEFNRDRDDFLMS